MLWMKPQSCFGRRLGNNLDILMMERNEGGMFSLSGVVIGKSLAPSCAGGAGMSSEACGPPQPDTPPSAARSPEVVSCWEGTHKGAGGKVGECTEGVLECGLELVKVVVGVEQW